MKGDLADAAALGLEAIAGVVAGAQDGIVLVDERRRFAYGNPAACEMLGYTLEALRGRDVLGCIAPREHESVLAHWSELLGDSAGQPPAPFTCNLLGPDGLEREVVYSQFALEVDGRRHGAAMFQDLTGPRAAARAAVVLARTLSQQVGSASADEILADVARRAVEGTRAVACGMATVHDGTLTSAGGHGLPAFIDENARGSLRLAFPDVSGDDVIEAMTAGAIVVGMVPATPVVLANARAVWQADPVTRPFLAMLGGLRWQAGVYVPLSWRNRVIGVFAVYLPPGVSGPTEAELALYTALADQAAVAHINARLNAQTREAAASVERARVARELHDTVSQKLFSMTMYAGATQLAIAQQGLDRSSPLGRAIRELAELTRGTLAEMRALIFELRPAALAEEGLVAGLQKQAAALNARESAIVTVRGPEARLEVEPDVEEHLYRIASEALHNVIKHSGARSATVSVDTDEHGLRIEVRDRGAGFDPGTRRPGHLGLFTMAERAAEIGADFALTSAPGEGTTILVSLPRGDPEPAPAGGPSTVTREVPADPLPPADELSAASGTREPATPPAGRGAPAPGGQPGWPAAVADASALGISALAGLLAGAQEGITVCDTERRFVYANPAACEMLGSPLAQLRGRDFLSILPAQEHDFALGRFSERLARRVGEGSAPFSAMLRDAAGAEREIVCATYAAEVSGEHHGVTIFRDVTGPRAAARAAVALAQAASQIVGAESADDILAGIAYHAVEGTRGLVCGISAVGEDDTLAEAGGYGPWGSDAGPVKNTGWRGFDSAPHGEVIRALTDGSVIVGQPPGKPLILADVRAIWAAHPVLEPLVLTLTDQLPGGAVCFPLSWDNRVFGLFTVCLPPGVPGPSETEFAFFAALADQAAVTVINSRLIVRARQAAALAERTRLARELHDSVSQALFSMTMHARAAQLAMAEAGVDAAGPLGSAVAELSVLARGAMAEMRALIFELRPTALAEEGLVAALRKQAAALTARNDTVITVEGPEARLPLRSTREECLYRIASEALHNVVNHSRATRATVSVVERGGCLQLAVNDDGVGFDHGRQQDGCAGLSAMAQRAASIAAELAISSAPGGGTTVVVTLNGD